MGGMICERCENPVDARFDPIEFTMRVECTTCDVLVRFKPPAEVLKHPLVDLGPLGVPRTHAPDCDMGEDCSCWAEQQGD